MEALAKGESERVGTVSLKRDHKLEEVGPGLRKTVHGREEASSH